ncbi:MAG: hypothetical protein JOZ68_18180 [Acidimicrobiia bacterium]|nr:hypothetical protein [Acidimicrobiia bacterium]MBV9042933.1 hypothetical protein [Acidimicrobiia bacterium]
MAPNPPTGRDVDDDVSFSWPGQQRRRPEQGVLEARVAERRRRLQEQQSGLEGAARQGDSARQAGSAGPTIAGDRASAPLPARREDVTPAEPSRTDRWIVTELRRQAVTTEASLRELNERIDQLSRTMRQVVEFLPRLQQQRAQAAGPAPQQAAVGGGAASAAISQRIDELEARIEARFDELAGAASALRSGANAPASGRPVAIDTAAVKAQVHEAMAEVTKELAAMGDRLRAELATAAGQAEARLNRDRDQMREALHQTVGKLNELVGGAASRDDLRQYWVEMAAKLAKQQEVIVSEREQLRADLAERLDQISNEREQLRVEVGERLARVAEAAAVRDRGTAADTKPIAAASAAQKAAIDELRRDLNQLGAQLLAATGRNAPVLTENAVENLNKSMAQAASALASAASKDDLEALRNQLAGTVTRLERALIDRVEEGQDRWEERLETALEAVQLAVDGVELNRRAMLAEVSAAVRATLVGFMPGISQR